MTDSFIFRRSWLACGFLCVSIFIGCSGDGGGGGGGGAIDTGAPKSSPVNGLDDDQSAQFCSGVAAEAASRLKADACTFDALFSAAITFGFTSDIEQARTACAESRDSCEQCRASGGEECQVDLDAVDVESCQEELTACSVSVGEAEACVGGILDRLRQELRSAPTCENLTEEDVELSEEDPQGEGTDLDEDSLAEQVPACDSVLRECPELVEG